MKPFVPILNAQCDLQNTTAGLHKSGHNLPSAGADVQSFEHQTACYKSIVFGMKELTTD